jgi:hypothetical protein
MTSRLLDRQNSLLEYLTSGAVIFGHMADASLDHARLNIDAGMLRLEAHFSHEKRMEKIESVLSRTFDLLGTSKAAIIRDFAGACPPVSIGWLENARQFHDFLAVHWQGEAPEPPYLPDLAACELAYASVRSGERQISELRGNATFPGIRRHPRVILVRCSYDVRPILEGRIGEGPTTRRDTPLVMSLPTGAGHPVVSKLSPDLFDLLKMLDDFVDLDAFTKMSEVSELVSDLCARGLLEVRQ